MRLLLAGLGLLLTVLIAVFGFLFANTNWPPRANAAKCCDSAAPATPRVCIAPAVWNAGFSRHRPRRAGGRQPLEATFELERETIQLLYV